MRWILGVSQHERSDAATGIVALQVMICLVKALPDICLTGTNGKVWLPSGLPTIQI